MDTSNIVELIDSLPDEKKAEVFDFVKFLRYQIAKERMLASDSEERLTFETVEELMNAIDNAD